MLLSPQRTTMTLWQRVPQSSGQLQEYITDLLFCFPSFQRLSFCAFLFIEADWLHVAALVWATSACSYAPLFRCLSQSVFWPEMVGLMKVPETDRHLGSPQMALNGPFSAEQPPQRKTVLRWFCCRFSHDPSAALNNWDISSPCFWRFFHSSENLSSAVASPGLLA